MKGETTPVMVRGPARPAPPALVRPPMHAPHPARVDPLKQVAHGIDRIRDAQHRLDHILRVAQSGKTFTPAELLALQAQVYQASNEIDLAGKVVDKATGGVKQILQTQV
ncbi:MAG TPA: type III secretion apparatus protein [Myxococcaceae bacterium]|nr:type III secretion apparatus protein [Myxococcaceae bacterium]